MRWFQVSRIEIKWQYHLHIMLVGCQEGVLKSVMFKSVDMDRTTVASALVI